MSSTSATTFTHTCDLCGKEARTVNHQSPFRKLYALDRSLYGQSMKTQQYYGADICDACQDRPVRDLLTWFGERGRG